MRGLGQEGLAGGGVVDEGERPGEGAGDVDAAAGRQAERAVLVADVQTGVRVTVRVKPTVTGGRLAAGREVPAAAVGAVDVVRQGARVAWLRRSPQRPAGRPGLGERRLELHGLGRGDRQRRQLARQGRARRHLRQEVGGEPGEQAGHRRGRRRPVRRPGRGAPRPPPVSRHMASETVDASADLWSGTWVPPGTAAQALKHLRDVGVPRPVSVRCRSFGGKAPSISGSSEVHGPARYELAISGWC